MITAAVSQEKTAYYEHYCSLSGKKKKSRRINWITYPEPVYAMDTKGDGSCLFHAILQAFSLSYEQEYVGGQVLSKGEMVKRIRRELAETLLKPFPRSRKNYYQHLNDGALAEFAASVPDFTIEALQKKLLSGESLGYGFLHYLSIIFERDIYILSAKHEDLYQSDEYVFSITNDRPTIVILHSGNHFETVGVLRDDTLITHFTPRDPFILMIKGLIK